MEDNWEPINKEVYDFQTPVTKDLKLRPVYGKPEEVSLAYLMYLLRYHPTKAKEIYPVGTELPDTEWYYNNPWIIVHYQVQEYRKNDIPHIGMTAILMRKYASSSKFTKTAWGTAAYSYKTTSMKTYANSTYTTRYISTSYQEAACQTYITLNATPSSVIQEELLGFIPSLTNVNATDSFIRPQGTPQNEVWEYFKGNNPNPHDTADPRRVCSDVTSGYACSWLLRSDCSSSTENGTSEKAGNYYAYVKTDGTFGASSSADDAEIRARFCITVAPDLSTPDSIEYLQQALDNDDTLYYPVGRSLVDEKDPGNPWKVAHFCPVRLANGEIHDGCWLVKEHVLPELCPFSESGNIFYPESTLHDRLNGKVWDGLSDDAKRYAAEVQTPYWDGEKLTTFSSKIRPLSATEFLGRGTYYEGEAFELWRQLTGTQAPSNSALEGRIVTSEAGAVANVWAYSRSATSTYIWGNTSAGATTTFTDGLAGNKSVLPAIFIAGNKSKQIPAEEFFGDLGELKESTQDKYPVGTEVTDDYDIGNPWVVMHYGNATDAKSQEKVGVYLRKKFFVDQTAWASSSSVYNYANSAIPAYMNNYLNKLPQVWKDHITQISVPFYTGSAMSTINASIWLMSATEMGGTGQRVEGFMFDYYRDVRGIEEPIAQNIEYSGFLETMPNGPTSVEYWLRSGRASSTILMVGSEGKVKSTSDQTVTTRGILPTCFVAHSDYIPPVGESN